MTTSTPLPPLAMTPFLRELIWGGGTLARRYGKDAPATMRLAESWEVADHEVGHATVGSGPWQGRTIGELVTLLGESLVGTAEGSLDHRSRFPLLFKMIDAANALSVQVHPDDATARRLEGDDAVGKHEAWLVLEAAPRARIYRGLREGVDEAALRDALARDDLEPLLHWFEASRGDVVELPPGTIHAIGEGVLLVEIQQSSDLTYRLHDWGRLGDDGTPRPLHIDKALQAISYEHPARFAEERRGHGTLPDRPTRLMETPHFTMDMEVGGVTRHLDLPRDRFTIVFTAQGAGTMSWDTGSLPLVTGRTVLVPAHHIDLHTDGSDDLSLLVISP